MPRLLIFSGSIRQASFNRKLAKAAVEPAQALGFDVTLLDLADYDMPLYNGDLEEAEGLPEATRRFQALLADHDALLISTPEYNGNMPPLLVNALDWASRSDGQDRVRPFAGKIAGIMAASPGGLGGIRVIPRLRAFLTDLGVVTTTTHATLPQAFKGFDDQGVLINERTAGQIQTVLEQIRALLKT
ncbi:NADPH-dependent FMN reductase [Maricaulis sp. D1M11]|uniref:NADPH-dependent FMN reductase n=1 Tax=Maricaulis sp. D1M11 TaxID=3076117 RepID=UPI0039B3FF40